MDKFNKWGGEPISVLLCYHLYGFITSLVEMSPQMTHITKTKVKQVQLASDEFINHFL